MEKSPSCAVGEIGEKYGRQAVSKSRCVADLRAPEYVEVSDLWRPASQPAAARRPESILLQREQITEAQLQQASARQREALHLDLMQILVDTKVIDELQAQQALAEYFQLPFQRIAISDVDPCVFGLLSPDYLKNKRVIPFGRDDESIYVGISNPADIFLIDDLRRQLSGALQLVVVPASDILRVVEELSTPASQKVDEIIKGIEEDVVEVVHKQEKEVAGDLEKIAGESPVIRYVNFVITMAVREGASDIHIEPGERPPARAAEDRRRPVRSALAAAEHARRRRLAAQDHGQPGHRGAPPAAGWANSRHRPRPVGGPPREPPADGPRGEVRRANPGQPLDPGRPGEPGHDADEMLARFRHQILQPHGMVLVTGPTGSGKSTTLYSALQIMDGDELNISTVEDPVEYELDFANQVNVHESIGMTFTAALRSLLRQDPDVVMIGEIRDAETARIAVQASLTGHMVLSTLHTNDAPFEHHAADQHRHRAVPDQRRPERGAGAAAGAEDLPRL